MEQSMKQTAPAALVMNMFYTGLGIARSLGERGVRVIGLSAQHGVYGNYTRYADVRFCPDSRENPAGLIEYLVALGKELGGRSIIFPTRDDDVLFLNRYRRELSTHFIPAIASPEALNASLDKWETSVAAQKAGVPAPRCWKIESKEDLAAILPEVAYPVVVKPLAAHYWRKAANWERVGQRKAICSSTETELRREYDAIAPVDGRVLVQEMIAGGDDQLLVAACYIARDGSFAAGFNIQKLAQVPEGFGTGCILRTADRPELVAAASRLLGAIGYTGIAEVEFKLDQRSGQYKLIEINPRPWDQHRLGNACGVDLIYAAYCDLAGQGIPPLERRKAEYKWVAEDVLLLALLRSWWRRDGKAGALWRLVRGKRIYAIWSAADPLPSIAYVPRRFIGGIFQAVGSRLGAAWGRLTGGRAPVENGVL